ncbi:MAG: ATP-binding protein, partial [Pedobacter sp.]|nr:ATP-binding protein [Pedobacter sp.]
NNAIKYNTFGGTITISEGIRPENYVLRIADSGLGMAAEAVKNAFNRFERVPGNDEDGFGLGLAIANSVAKFHGILVDIQSEKGHGTMVSISFPL